MRPKRINRGERVSLLEHHSDPLRKEREFDAGLIDRGAGLVDRFRIIFDSCF